MNSLVIPDRAVTNDRTEAKMLRQKHWWSIALTGSGVVGAVIGSLAVFFATISLLHLSQIGVQVDLISTVLIASTFSILIFAAHCLDKIDQAKAEIREAKVEMDAGSSQAVETRSLNHH